MTRFRSLLLTTAFLLGSSAAFAEGVESYAITPYGTFYSVTSPFREGFVDSRENFRSAPDRWKWTIKIAGKPRRVVVTPCGQTHINFLDGRSFKQAGCPEDER